MYLDCTKNFMINLNKKMVVLLIDCNIVTIIYILIDYLLNLVYVKIVVYLIFMISHFSYHIIYFINFMQFLYFTDFNNYIY